MKNLKQWIVWKPTPVDGTSKVKKVPCDPLTGYKINPLDPKHWMDYATAKKYSPIHIGFVLTKDDPYFCIDLDNALINGSWSKYAVNICHMFDGIYTEVSYSGKGLHLFGIINSSIPDHNNKHKCEGEELEIYSNNRFIAFSEKNAVGNCNIDCTEPLNKLISKTWPKPTGSNMIPKPTGSDTATVDPEWLGPDDDNELIKIMLNSKQSGASELRGIPTIQDLWNGNIDVLSEKYPSELDTYDRSAADFDLFKMLAFWTGKNPERMERIARLSELKRDKWDFHKKYLSDNTIPKACGDVKKVYRNPKMEAELNTTGVIIRQAVEQLGIHLQIPFFEGCVYIVDAEKILTPRNGIINLTAFDAVYGGSIFEISTDWKKSTRKASEAFVGSTIHRFPKADTTFFAPDKPYGEIVTGGPLSKVNTYRPPDVKFTNGNVDKYLYLLDKLFPDRRDYDIAINYAAACVQYPAKKFRWCIIIQGSHGNGKTLFLNCIRYAVGREYTKAIKSIDIDSKFDSWLNKAIFVVINEFNTGGKQSVIDAIRPMITDSWVDVQPKGLELVPIDNIANFGMTTNPKKSLKGLVRDRRFAIFYTPQQKKGDNIRDGLTQKFFKEFGNELENGGYDDVAGYLKRYPIKDELNPATTLLEAPATSNFNEAAIDDRESSHQEVQEAIDQGLYGFKGGWISSWCVNKLMREQNLIGSSRPNAIKKMVTEMGFIVNPWSLNGRSSRSIQKEDNSRPTLYILEKMQYDNILAKNVTETYMVAQK